MSNSLTKRPAQELMDEINNQYEIYNRLCQFKSLQGMRPEDLMTVVVTAQGLGLSPFLIFQKRLYPVNGKIEIDSQIMNRLIRQAGHSIKEIQLDNEGCVLSGKRADNGDTITASFTKADAIAAGLANKDNYRKFSQDMYFARALSRLARRLFPDVIQGCYVSGEISDSQCQKEDIVNPEGLEESEYEVVDETPRIDEDQAAELFLLLQKVPEYKDQVIKVALDMGIEENLVGLPVQHANMIMANVEKLIEKEASNG